MNFARFFRSVQDAPWYAHFLSPVLEALRPLPSGSRVLDIGTGAGKLIELGLEQLDLDWVGVDVDEDMLAQARQRAALRNTPLQQLQAGEPLPYDDSTFDVVTFCSVLFLLPDPVPLLQETCRVLRPNGQIIALTPTGTGPVSPALLRHIGGNPRNATIFLWRSMTASGGQGWHRKDLLAQFAHQHQLAYSRSIQFHDLALLEVLMKADR